MTKYLIRVALLLGCIACQPAAPVDPEYLLEHDAWRQERMEELKAPDGWLALTGLYWLEPGTNSFGSDSSHAVVFPPKAPATVGAFTLQGDSVLLDIAPGIEVVAADSNTPVTRTVLRLSPGSPPARLQWGPLEWVLLERGGRYGIRLWDRENPAIEELESIPAFPIDASWIVEATLIPADSGRTVTMQNVLGMTIQQASAGVLEFKKGNDAFRLEALSDPEGYFLIFSDETTGEETYSGGRYLHAPAASPSGKVLIDFNKAYNPPCVFTKYATCLLPPAENRLSIAVRAGEKTLPGHEN